jgi:hypothetical protein
MPTDERFAANSVALVEAVVAMAARASVEYACLPHLQAVHDELTTASPATGIDPDIHAAWRVLFSGAVAMMPTLIAEALVHPDGERVHSALLVLVEGMTRREDDSRDRALRVMNGSFDRDDVVRDMIAAARARDQAASAHDPSLVAELDAADRIDAGGFWVPLPQSARPSASTYLVRATLDHLAAFYTCWAQRAGWRFEMVLDNDRYKAISFRHDGWTFDIQLSRWINGENAVSFEWPAGTTATLVINAVATPSLPPVTRERPRALGAAMPGPLGEVDALLANGGVVFAATGHAVWLIDPVARTSTLFAELTRGTSSMSVRGLAADGADLLVRTSVPQAIWRIDPTGARTEIAIPLAGYLRAFAYLDQVGYFACDDGRVVAIVLSTGVATDLGQFSEPHALCARDGVLYVAAGRAVHAIDLSTRATRELATLSKTTLGLASDGASLYTLHDRGIGRIDLATSAWTQIAGMPDLGAGNYLAMEGKPPPDGIVDRAIIDSARYLSYDAGGLWFSERTRLRRLALAERHVTSLEL